MTCGLCTHTQTPSNTVTHAVNTHPYYCHRARHHTTHFFAQDRPLGLAVAPLSMSTSVLARRPHGPVGSGRAGQRSRSQNGPVSSLVPGSSGAERGGFVYFQYVFITESKGCSWATRLWRQRAIVARRPDHSEIAELTGTGAVARQTEQAKFTLATELTHLIMIDHCRQKTKQPTHGKCL